MHPHHPPLDEWGFIFTIQYFITENGIPAEPVPFLFSSLTLSRSGLKLSREEGHPRRLRLRLRLPLGDRRVLCRRCSPSSSSFAFLPSDLVNISSLLCFPLPPLFAIVFFVCFPAFCLGGRLLLTWWTNVAHTSKEWYTLLTRLRGNFYC